MIKGKIRPLFVLLFIIVLGMTNTVGNPTLQKVYPAVIEIQDRHTESQALDPIVILSDVDFQNQGWPGNGSASNPYMISDLEVAGNSSYPAIMIEDTTAYFVIDNCTLQDGGFYWTVRMNRVQNGVINDCVISDASSLDIFLSDSISFNVSSCVPESEAFFITVVDSSSCNFLLNSGVSIGLDNSTGCKILHNQIGTGGIDINGPEEQYWAHEIENNTRNGGKIGYFSGISNQILDVSEYSELLVGFCSRTIFENGMFSGDVLLYYTSYCTLTDSEILGEVSVVRVWYSNHTTLDSCVINPDIGGISVRHSDNTTLSFCDISLTAPSGRSVWFHESTRNSLLNNTMNVVSSEPGQIYAISVEGNDSIVVGNSIQSDGFFMSGSNSLMIGNIFQSRVQVSSVQNFLIQHNIFENVTDQYGAALEIQWSENVTIADNSIVNNFGEGVHLYKCTNCEIYGNQIGWNLFGNAADDLGENNTWDDGISIGNAWSDYSGEGVYEIFGTTDSIDRFPTLLTETPQGGLDSTILVIIIGIGVVAVIGVVVVFLKKRGG
ncbi:MAG: NosD domain-containing protein [Candidatus Thorarchaeota archaeon]|jgi:parallel beta-helix repeat protein